MKALKLKAPGASRKVSQLEVWGCLPNRDLVSLLTVLFPIRVIGMACNLQDPRSLNHLAMFGLLAYPSLGIYKSLASIGLTGAESKILAARLLHGEFMAMKRPVNHSEVSQVLHDFGGA